MLNRAEQIEDKVKKAYIRSQNNQKGDDGALVADHTSYAGNRTEEHMVTMFTVDGDVVRNIKGDYFLKVTGDCHIEVGGGFFLGAEGAPKVVDKKGEKKIVKVQKHTLRFGSDVDVNTVGAKFELQGAEANIASTSTKITGSMFENSASQQSSSGRTDL